MCNGASAAGASSSVAARCRFDSAYRWRLSLHIVDVRDILGACVVQPEWAAARVHGVALQRRIDARARPVLRLRFNVFLTLVVQVGLRSLRRANAQARRRPSAFAGAQSTIRTPRPRRRRYVPRGALDCVRGGLFVRRRRLVGHLLGLANVGAVGARGRLLRCSPVQRWAD